MAQLLWIIPPAASDALACYDGLTASDCQLGCHSLTPQISSQGVHGSDTVPGAVIERLFYGPTPMDNSSRCFGCARVLRRAYRLRLPAWLPFSNSANIEPRSPWLGHGAGRGDRAPVLWPNSYG